MYYDTPDYRAHHEKLSGAAVRHKLHVRAYGENSHPILLNNLYVGCNIGVSCKDLSSPKIAFCTFIDNNLAIAAKQKKPFFGGATGNFASCVFYGNKNCSTKIISPLASSRCAIRSSMHK